MVVQLVERFSDLTDKGLVMPAASIPIYLLKTFGPTIAAKLFSALQTKEDGKGKLERALELSEKGASLVEQLRKQFGPDFDAALTEAGSTGATGWSYEAGCSEYIKVLDGADGRSSIDLLRDELNINLDRISLMGNAAKTEVLNYFRGVLSEWKKRYISLLGEDEHAAHSFAAMQSLLDGEQRTYKDALNTIRSAGLGTAGALLIISGGLLATSTGVGVVTMITTFLFGIPLMTVSAFVIPGVILLALSRYKFTDTDAMSSCASIAYRLLEHQRAIQEKEPKQG
jgi:hypothetical protein